MENTMTPTTIRTLTYTNYTNIDAGFMRPYEQGDRVVKGWTGSITVDDPTNVEAIAERIFAKHNRDDRPDGRLCPSMSVGDVIIFGEVAVSVASMGWEIVHLDADDIIDDRSWVDVIKELR
jgi:hypothetical protein